LLSLLHQLKEEEDIFAQLFIDALPVEARDRGG
jgi:hypothetical protein